MPRRCTICTHEKRGEIERALIRGEPFRDVASRFGTSPSALHRHKTSHLAENLAKAYETTQVTRAVDLAREAEEQKARDLGQAIDTLQQLKAINAACLEVLQKSRSDGKDSLSLKAVDRIHRQIELQAKLLGELQDQSPQVNVLVAPEWQEVRVIILRALGPYPEARQAVADALEDAGG